jgi:processive 1,2-diacylglycerol beta-glucosyltransferase
LQKEVRNFRPDMVICTHSLAASVTLMFKEKFAFNELPIFVVTTDYGIHPYWPLRGIQSYFVANNPSKKTLLGRGVRAPIFVFGIPVRSGIQGRQRSRPRQLVFYTQRDALKVLILAGGSKSAHYATLWPRIYTLLSLAGENPELPLEMNVVLGNATLARLFFENMSERPKNIHIRGYINNMPALLQETDVVICKPGGLIIAETLAAGLPVLLMNKGGGQEAENAKFIHASGAGLLSRSPERIFEALVRLAEKPAERTRFIRAAQKLGKPLAADKIVAEIVRQTNRF